MFDHLLPRRRPYHAAAVEVTGYLVDEATHVRGLLAAPAERDHHVAAVTRLVREVDRVTHEVQVRLHSALITPVDHEDIHGVAVELGHVAHLIGDIARRVGTYRVAEPHEPAVRLADALVRACHGLLDEIEHVRESTLALQAEAAVRAVDHDADALYTRAVEELFASPPPVLEVIKWKDLYDLLEDAVDGCANAAAVIAHAAVTHG